MGANEQTINTFATRVRQMILQFEEMKKENADLYLMVEERDAKIKEIEGELVKLRDEYDLLKTAKMLEVTDKDVDGAKKRMAKLVRDVNKCITLLSEQ